MSCNSMDIHMAQERNSFDHKVYYDIDIDIDDRIDNLEEDNLVDNDLVDNDSVDIDSDSKDIDSFVSHHCSLNFQHSHCCF